MKQILAVFTMALLFPLAALPATEPVVQERELLRHDFATVPQKPWLQPHGFWKADEKVLRGSENPAEHHGASVKGYAAFHNALFRYEVRFDGGRVHTLGLNQPRDHLFHIDFKPDEVRIVKNDLDKDGPEKPELLASEKLQLKPGQWYEVEVQIQGETVHVRIGNTRLSATHSYIAREKGSFNLYVNGDSVCFRNFHLTTTEPAQ